MKECFAITSYCNSNEKIKILNNTIDNLKLFNIDIILHTHIPLDSEIQKKVNLYYYSSDNPILPRYNLFWYDVYNFRLEYKKYDVAFAVMKQWKEIINIAKDYDVIHFINYDINISQEIYDLTIKNITTYNKSVFYENFVSPNLVQVINFSLLKNDFINFSLHLDKDEYLRYPSSNNLLPSIEEYITSTINNDYRIIPLVEYDEYIKSLLQYEINEIILDGNIKNINPYIKLENNYYQYSKLGSLVFSEMIGYNIFIGFYNYDYYVFLFNIQEKIIIDINNKSFEISEKYILFKLEENIKINNIHIDEYLIDSFKKLDCKIYDHIN
jgi:uncharacterized protein YcfL